MKKKPWSKAVSFEISILTRIMGGVDSAMSKGVVKSSRTAGRTSECAMQNICFDVVRVSKQKLIGEIIEMHGDEASIRVYEGETSGLGPESRWNPWKCQCP